MKRPAVSWILGFGAGACLLLGFAAGWTASNIASAPPTLPPGPPPQDRVASRIDTMLGKIDGMTPDQQQKIRGIMLTRYESSNVNFGESIDERVCQLRQIVLNPDDEALAARFRETTARMHGDMADSLTGTLRESAREMTPAQRAQFAEQVGEFMPGRRSGGRRFREGRDDKGAEEQAPKPAPQASNE